MTMPHPDVSLAHEAFIATLTDVVENGTTNEQYLASLLLDIYKDTATHPAVVAVLNRYALRAAERIDDGS